MKQLIAFLIALVPTVAFAAGGSSVPLDHAKVDLEDKASLQRGAQVFMNYCMGCHSLEYARYNRVAKDLGIPEGMMQDNLVFADKKIGSLMSIAMRKEDSKVWFGATPPDLTLVARVRNPDWLYTYLRSFYQDSTRPYGVNNTVFKDVGMPNVLGHLQGKVEKGCAPKPEGYDPLTGQEILVEKCDVLYQVEEGQLSPKEFDNLVLDLVNFLEYMGEPVALERQRIGWFALLFLLLMLVPVYFLNQEYWKDVK